MDSGFIFFACLICIPMGICILAFYTYLLYDAGRNHARKRRPARTAVQALTVIAMISCIPAFTVLLLPFHPLVRITIAVGIWIFHAQPAALGFWAGCDEAKMTGRERMERQAEDWLRHWDAIDS